MQNGDVDLFPTSGSEWKNDCALMLIDENGTITFANPAATSTFRLSKEDMTGRAFSTLANIISDAEELFTRTIAGEVFVDREILVDNLQGSGSHKRMRMSFIPFRDTEKIRGIVCLFTTAIQGEIIIPSPQGTGFVAVVLQEDRLVFASPNFFEVTGIPLEEMLEMDFTDLVHPEDKAELLRALRESSEENAEHHQCRFRLLTRSGEMRWFEAAASPWTWEGRPAAAAIASDITIAKEKEIAYRSLFEGIEETIACDELVLDAGGGPVDWIIREINAAYEKAFGVTREEIVGKKATAVFGDDIVKSFLPAFFEAVTEQRTVRFDFYHRETDRYSIVSAFPMGGLRFGTIGLDVSDHRRAEKERERLLAELDATINAIAEAVIIYGPDGEILRMNPVARDFLRYGTEEASQPMDERLAKLRVHTPSGSTYPLKEKLEQVFSGETIRGELLVFPAPEGPQRWISASAAPVYTADGRLIGAVGTAADVSRVWELQEEREVYLHTISHDLRTPLTVIEGHAQLLQARAGDGDFDPGESIDAIIKGVQGMTGMIDTLVDTAFLESGQLELKKESVHLPSFIEDYLHRAEIALGRERISLGIPPELPAVKVDPRRLERILSNLLSNALKYSYAGSTVSLTARMEGEEEVRVSVHDEGPGIDPEDLPHIFERFYKTKHGRKGKGIGLGLYISRLLTEAHGGRIQVASEPGKGCTFSFTLPMN
jgi:PAS domain S-box-containing protein